MKSLKSQNYYEILSVSRGASPEDIRKSYEISRQTFQENSIATYSLFTDDENQEILALISRAYETLFNPELRREYDSFLDGLERESAAGGDSRPRTLSRSAPPPPSPGRVKSATPSKPPSATPSTTPSTPPPREARNEPAAEGRQPAPEMKPDAVEQYLSSVSCFTGPVLKKIREMRGYSLEDIAERTKIRKTYIQYLECEQFTFLPAPVYVRGFITLIAGMLNLPAQRVADDYMNYYRGHPDF